MKDNRIMETHEVDFPFVRADYEGPVDGEFASVKTWCPGTRLEPGEGYYDDSGEYKADGMGKMVLQIVGRFKPGKYPERTFYLRSFIDPSGRTFGKDKLRVMSSSAFKGLLRGYRHEFILEEAGVPA